MKKFVKLTIFSIALSLVTRVSFGFTLPENVIELGSPVYIDGADPSKHYAVFLPFEEPTNGEVCSSMSGEELSENNNLREYGTCFINDEGIFTIVEISEPFSSSYEDLSEKGEILQEESVTLQISLTLEEIIEKYDFIEESSESTSSSESGDETWLQGDLVDYILGARTANVVEILKQNSMIIFASLLIIISCVLLGYLLKIGRKKRK